MNLRNEGMKGWGATCSVATIILWLICALMSVYTGMSLIHGKYGCLMMNLGLWKGDLLYAPGLHGMVQKEEIENLDRAKAT